MCRVLRSDTALDGEASLRDGFLGETELREGGTSSNLDLGGDDVDTSDLLYMMDEKVGSVRKPFNSEHSVSTNL